MYIKSKELKLWSLFTLLLALFNVLEIKYFFPIVILLKPGGTSRFRFEKQQKKKERFMSVFDVFNSNKHQVNSFVGKQSEFIFEEIFCNPIEKPSKFCKNNTPHISYDT